MSLLPRIIGRLGLYATYVAAALLVFAIGGDLGVLVLHARVEGWLALLVGPVPLVALLLSTIASYINYYGVWRILRGRDEYDAREDLKTHATDIPQAVQSLLARMGCMSAVSTAVLCFSLLLAAVSSLPPQTPFIGELGTWQSRLGNSATPTPIPVPTATPTAIPTPTPTAAPSPTPSPTPIPVVIKFSISPATASWDCNTQGQGLNPAGQTITLDNSGSTVAVNWQATVVESITGVNGSPSPWATLSASSGTISEHDKQALTITPVPTSVCYASNPPPNGTPWHVSVVVAGAGTYTFTYTVFYVPPIG